MPVLSIAIPSGNYTKNLGGRLGNVCPHALVLFPTILDRSADERGLPAMPILWDEIRLTSREIEPKMEAYRIRGGQNMVPVTACPSKFYLAAFIADCN